MGIETLVGRYGDPSGYAAYDLVVAGGIILSIVYGKLSGSIVQKMNLKKAS